MILVDSYGWIEYLGAGPKAEKYARYITQTPTFEIVTPSLVVFEVYRKVKKERGEEKALEAQAHLEETRTVSVDSRLAVAAAEISLKTGLGTVDAVIYATANHHCRAVDERPPFQRPPQRHTDLERTGLA